MSTWNANEPGRLDVLVAQQEGSYSRVKIQRLIEEGNVTLNNQVCLSPKHGVKAGDVIAFTPPPAEPTQLEAHAIDLDILFEDEHLLVINKPAGMIVHPNSFYEQKTLVQAVLALYPEVARAVYDPENEISRLRPGIVHRLDKDTSGVIVVAKTEAALKNLAEQFHNHTTEKTYTAILYGTLTEKKTIDAPIRRKGGGDKNRMGASHDPEEGRAAVSHIKPIKSWTPSTKWPQETVTLVEVVIETGRTHQIRVHSKFIGYPVMGDTLYGNKPSIRLSEKLGITRQLLHATTLAFTHPITGERLRFTAPLPQDFLF